MARLAPVQIRAARGMLGWSMLNLANAARLSVSTVERFETGDPQPVSDEAVGMMQRAAETEGVRFLPDEGKPAALRGRI